MRLVFVALVVVAVVAGIGPSPPGSSVVGAPGRAEAATSPPLPQRTIVLFGHARSLAQKRGAGSSASIPRPSSSA